MVVQKKPIAVKGCWYCGILAFDNPLDKLNPYTINPALALERVQNHGAIYMKTMNELRFLGKSLIISVVFLYFIHMFLSFICMNYPFENVEHAIFQLAAFLDWGHIVLYLVGIMPFLGIAIDVILAKKIKKINALRFSILMTVTILASELPIYFCFVHKDFEVFWNTIHLK